MKFFISSTNFTNIQRSRLFDNKWKYANSYKIAKKEKMSDLLCLGSILFVFFFIQEFLLRYVIVVIYEFNDEMFYKG